MKVHLVDGTYELFRAHFSKRPDRTDVDGADVKATVGVLESVLYLLRGNPSDPTQPSWGGRFVLPLRDRPTYWHDDPDPRFRFAGHDGATHVSLWRSDYLRDWQRRLAALPLNVSQPKSAENP